MNNGGNSLKEVLKKYCNQSKIDINDIQLNQFSDYYELLVEWNKVMNLTGITEIDDVAIKHYIDSIACLKFYQFSNSRIADVGTGAGFPGIPLAIMCPDCSFTLIDSLNKRITFLEEVCKSLNLSNVSLIHGRVEDVAHDSKYREQFDIVVSRAVAPLNILLEYTIPFLKVNGKLLSYKAKASEEELSISENAFKVLNVSLINKHDYKLPNDDDRVLMEIELVDKLEDKYPRNPGKIKKKPL